MHDTLFSAEFNRCGDVEILTLSGELDLLSASALWGALEFVPETEHIVIDCARIEFMDSYALRAIISQRNKRARRGGTIMIRNPSMAVMRVFDVCGDAGLLVDQPLAS